MKRILNLTWKEFIYGGHLQCLGVAGIAYVSSFLLNIETNWKILLLAYLIFYPIYINDRFKGIKLDESTNPERTKHLKSYLSLIPKIILLSVFLLIALLVNIGNTKVTSLSLILLVSGFLYPSYFKNLTKKIFAFKNFYVAFFFAAIAFLPVLYNPQIFPVSLLVCFALLVFLKTVLMQILLDYKDTDEDRAIGLLTVPVLIGKEKTLDFLKIANTITITMILFLSALLIGDFPLQMMSLLLLIPFDFFVYNLVRKENYYGYLLIGGEFILWPILILIAKIIPIIL